MYKAPISAKSVSYGRFDTRDKLYVILELYCNILSNLPFEVTWKYGRVVSYQRLKTIEKIESLALKAVAVVCEKWPLTRGFDHGYLLDTFWYFRKVIA